MSSMNNLNSRKLFETTASTIQAGDASLLLNNNSNLMDIATPKLKTNLTKSQSSELLAFKVQQQQQQQRNGTTNQVELKCLNDYILPNNFIETNANSKKLKAASNVHDVYVRDGRHRSTSEDTLQSNFHSNHHHHQSRKLHAESDLLPTENTFEQQQLKILANISNGTNSNNMMKRHLAVNSTANILDKLSASSSNRNLNTIGGGTTSNVINEFYSSSAHEFFKPPPSLSRKVAVTNSVNNYEYQIDEKERQIKKQKKSEFMTSLDPNNHFGLALQPPPPTSQSTTKFDMYQSKLFTNPTTSSLNNISYETQQQQQQLEMKNNKKNTGIITTSSWRIGEAIAKKQLKQHFQQLQENDNRSKPSPKKNNSNENSPIQTNANKRVKQQQKYTECQLISPNPATTKTNTQQHQQQSSSKYNLNTNAHIPSNNVKSSSSAPPPSSSSANKNNTNKSSYDVQKYMQSQKSKRLHEIKSEKEKLKQKEDERKKRLQELYQKQRRTTSASAGITTTATTIATPTTPTSASTILANNIQYQRGNSSVPPPNHQHLHTKISKSNSGTDTQKVSNFYEQDMSKVLMDKISYLLNDNDKLVDRQRARFELNAKNRARETQVGSNRTSQLASANHRSVSSSGGKRVEFNTIPAVVNGSGRDHYNTNENLNNTVDIETDENNKENYSEESSFDYSSSVTLTPTANSFKSDGYKNDSHESKKLIDDTSSNNINSSSNHNKNDRLKKICSMALDLQTKLQQAKLKIFGLNPSSDNDPLKKQHIFDADFYDTTTNDLNETDLFGKDKLISYENMFKQTVREARTDTNPIKLKQSPTTVELSNTKLPGITNMNDFKPNYLTQDIAARKIQHAYRQHLIRKRQRQSTQTKSSYKQKNTNNTNSSTTTKHTTIVFAKNTNNNNIDNYNFINIYKKRVTTENFNLLSKSKQKLAINTANSNKDLQQQQQQQNSSSSSSSSLTSSIVSEAAVPLTHSSSSNTKQNSSIKKKSSSAIIQSLKSKSKESLKLDVYDNEETMSVESSSSSSSTSSLSSTNSSTSSSSASLTLAKTKGDSVELQQQHSRSSQIHKQLVSSSLNNINMENETRKRPMAISSSNGGEMRYTPAALEQLFNAGLNHLDVLNLSALQLEELDKMRCIGVAQQETVALAHLIKSQKNNEATSQIEQQLSNSSVNKILTSKNVENKIVKEADNSTNSYHLKNKKQKQQLLDEMQKLKKRHQNGSGSNSSTSSSSPDSRDPTKHDKVHSKKLSLNTDDEMNDELEKSFRQLLPSESHLKKSKQDTTKDALDMSSFLVGPDTSMQQLQSHLQQSHQSNARFFEDDSFKKFTGEIVKKYMQEEELRSKHQAHLLKLREKALIEKTDAELAWLEQMKKKAQDKGEDEKMPSILNKQKGIIQKLKEEQENINKMKEVHKKASENRLKILSQHSEVISWCQNKLKSGVSTQKLNGVNGPIVVPTNGASNINQAAKDPNTHTSESSFNENEDYSMTTTEDDEQHNQLDESNINQSLIESKILKQVKQHLNSEKYLTEREKKLRLRRMHAEEIIAWKKKLDDEEFQVREIEKKANQLLNSGKKDESKTNITLKVPTEIKHSKVTKAKSNPNEEEDIKTDINLNIPSQKNDKSYSDSFEASAISTNLPSASLITKKHSTASSTTTKDAKTIKTATMNKSNIDESIKTQIQSSTNKHDEFSTINENLNETKTNNETSVSESSSSTSLASSSTSVGTTTTATTATTANDLEIKVKQLKDELIKKKNEAEKLRQTLKLKEKSKLKEREEFLRKKINSYDSLIDKIKVALEKEQEAPPLPPKVQDDTQIKSKKTSQPIPSKQLKSKSETLEIKTESIKDEISHGHEEDEDVTSTSSTSNSTSLDNYSIKNFNKQPKIPSQVDLKQFEEPGEVSTTSTSSKKSVKLKAKVDSQSSNLQQQSILSENKYDDDDFVVNSENPNKSSASKSLSSSSASSLTKSSAKKKIISSLKPNKELDLKAVTDVDQEVEFSIHSKSTASEISEEVLLVDAKINKEKGSSKKSKDSSSIKEDINKNMDTGAEEEYSESTEESTDTQILLLGSSRKPANTPSPLNIEPSHANTAPATITNEKLPDIHGKNNDDDDFKIDTDSIEGENNYGEDLGEDHLEDEEEVTVTKSVEAPSIQSELLAETIQNSLLDQNISQMLQVRNQKLEKIFMAQRDEISAEDEEIDLEATSSKILIPAIDLSLDEESVAGSLTSRLRESKQLVKEPTLNVPFTKEKLGLLSDMAIENYFWPKVENKENIINFNLTSLVNEPALKTFFQSEISDGSNTAETPAKTSEQLEMEVSFKQMILDLIGELMYDLYLENYDRPQQISEFLPGIKTSLKKQHFRSNPKGPRTITETKHLIKDKILRIFKFNPDPSSLTTSKKYSKSKWRSQKPLDLVDSLLDSEMREQEHDWSNYDQEEHEAKLLISNTIFDIILKDTIECFQINFLKKQMNA